VLIYPEELLAECLDDSSLLLEVIEGTLDEVIAESTFYFSFFDGTSFAWVMYSWNS